MTTEIPIPRYDFYQTPSELILAIYLKGYDKVKDDVKVDFETTSIKITLPPLPSGPSPETQSLTLSPLASELAPGSSFRVLGTKLELKLQKGEAVSWPTLLADPTKPPVAQQAGPSSSRAAGASAVSGGASKSESEEVAQKKKEKRNWDKFDVEEEENNASDPNAGGDAALQKFFSQLYGDADDDTRRAMIKSFTESGGTTLSTDWSNIGKQTTPIRPPEGVEAKKF
ncbi:hypothetical protein L202_05114 [Cryptococcus amylolentus CBS 6039]|uniref:SGS domain-containing protein n=2 Tax=Cryptococcus amylolentus TaxID=104669 RepID=A0A1E3HRF7_9TREE|nr:hypothetical protein L202_05114 [Cryptococcus amylolentus CBS 6039]ODN78031.1 hypothetical protein L202_05114 [Cryptococcus amylolentus CBS 6039]ODO05977.1 hypothetical protein I350_05038 [Cryptococcus amylolentus CBS 6273]